MSDDDWLDELLLVDDVSERGWKRRAVGMSTTQAASRIPKTGQFTIKIPIGQWRIVREHVRNNKMGLSMFMRHAMADKLIAEGVDPATIPALTHGR